jgi:hypothetical protein
MGRARHQASGVNDGVDGMTQAQVAGGTVDASQARPEKGQLIRGFTLISALGHPISLSDYRGRSNLVLVLAQEEIPAKPRSRDFD